MEQLGYSYPLYYGYLDPRSRAYLYYVLQQQRQRQQQQQQEEEFMQSAENLGFQIIDYGTLTSFLEVDDSFLTTWNWNPSDVAKKNGSRICGRKRRMYFAPGSFFSSSHELPKW